MGAVQADAIQSGATDAVLAKARAWRDQDPDAETRAELDSLIERSEAGSADALADLHDRFDTRLAFGTAGLRGEIAAGSNRMNRVLVTQAAAGLAAYLKNHAAVGDVPTAVIGYDGRKNSRVFAEDSAEILAGAGVRAILLPRLLPTPVLAFAVRHLDASAGIMVTASHNPPNDNGYKVYLGGRDNGAQIVSAADAEIAEEILMVASGGSISELPRSAYEIADEAVVDEYIRATASIVNPPRAQVDYVYTAMHGVGWETFSKVVAAAGIDQPHVVDAQIAPDAAFPTVAFPNPEEPGAMDLSFEEARARSAELVIANDPDADRLAVAIPDEHATDGYRRLSGNEVGLLLGWWTAERNAAGRTADDGSLACSIVSSPGLGAVARAYELDFSNTLTGFKWISRAPGIVFGFEEALGYLVNPETVRDKDGISAAVAFLSIANDLKADGLTIADRLRSFTETFGAFLSGQISIRVTDLSEIGRVMTRLRDEPPAVIGGIKVDHIDDLADGFGGLPPSDVLRIQLVDGSRVMLRPSGTEPKLKIYIDTQSDEGSQQERVATAAASLHALDAGMRELLG
jgi:phosphomannomutase